MATFKDLLGRPWSISLTVAQIKCVREEMSIDFGRMIAEPEKFAEIIMAAPETIGGVFWRLVRQQAELTEDQFLEGIDGPTIERGVEALMQAIVDFFPRSKIAAALKTQLPQIFEEMDRQTIAHLNSTSKPSVTASPA